MLEKLIKSIQSEKGISKEAAERLAKQRIKRNNDKNAKKK